jgi:hypothetical protein
MADGRLRKRAHMLARGFRATEKSPQAAVQASATFCCTCNKRLQRPVDGKGEGDSHLSFYSTSRLYRLKMNDRNPPRPALPGQTGVRIFRWIWTALVVVATSFPYVLNYFSTSPGFHYTWILPPYPEDSLAYMAWSQQAAHGSLLFQLKYTALPHAPFLFHPFFLVCGWISALCACDVGVVHWAMKALGVVLFLRTFFKYTDHLGLGRIESAVASILVGVASGLGGLLVFLGYANRLPVFPVDLQVVDTNTYWCLLWNPLFPYALTLMLLAVDWLDRGTRDAHAPSFWLGGLATGVLALIHPYSQPLLVAFAVIVTLVRRRAGAGPYLGRFFGIWLPFALYVVWAVKLHPLLGRHSSLGAMKSPGLIAYALGFGLPLVLGVAGLVVGRGRLVKRYWQVILWFLLSVAFCHLPVWFQRKLIFGAHIPLCVLAGISAGWILGRCRRPAARGWILAGAAIIFLPLLVLTPVCLLVNQNREVRENADGAYYVSDEVMDGLKFLKQGSRPGEVVFATPATSRLIPAYSGNTVVWGHWAMSVDRSEREAWLTKLFNGRANWEEESRSRDFWGSGIQYIFADGELKRALEQNPRAWRVILRDADEVFTNGSVRIYRRREG